MPHALLISPSTEEITKYQNYSCTIWAPDHDIRPPWLFTDKYDLVVSDLWPQEKDARIEFLARIRQLLSDQGQVIISRKDFEQSLSYKDLPTILPKNNWLLASSFLAELPIPQKLVLQLTNLQDKYPQKARFLKAIMESIESKNNLSFNCTVNETAEEISLIADGPCHIEMLLNRVAQTFLASIQPADSNLFEQLSRFIVSTLTNEIAHHELTKTEEIWTTTIVASA